MLAILDFASSASIHAVGEFPRRHYADFAKPYLSGKSKCIKNEYNRFGTIKINPRFSKKIQHDISKHVSLAEMYHQRRHYKPD